MTEWLLMLILGLLALCLIGAICGLIELVLGWLDRRDADRLSEEWRRRAEQRREKLGRE